MVPTSPQRPRATRVVPPWVQRVDRGVGRRLNASRSWHIPDRASRMLSHSADYGGLWYAVAAVLAAAGRPRAAVRGAASMIVAGLLSDLVVKRFFSGSRPPAQEVPHGRRLRVYPTNPSFPSGHAASAAGFATGVFLESGSAGLVVAPLAAIVAYSRLHAGAHWLSDVVGGLTIGVVVAALGRLLLPARRRG